MIKQAQKMFKSSANVAKQQTNCEKGSTAVESFCKYFWLRAQKRKKRKKEKKKRRKKEKKSYEGSQSTPYIN